MTAVSGTSLKRDIDALQAESVRLMWAAMPQLRTSMSDSAIESSEADMRYHLLVLSSAMWAGDTELVRDYARWVGLLFDGLDLPAEWFSMALDYIRTACGSVLSADVAAEAGRYIDAALDAYAEPRAELETELKPDEPHGPLAMRYLNCVIAGDRREAIDMLDDALAEGVPIDDIYRWVLQPAQRELGRLWLSHRISVAVEHSASAITSMAMNRLFGRLFHGVRNGRTVVAACVGGEQHELGLRMVTDFLDMARWDTRYLGANTPTTAIVEGVADAHADLVVLSVTMVFNVEEVAGAVAALRADERTAEVKILVGGYPFSITPGLCERVGADACAYDADEAVRVADQLVAQAN